MTAAEPTWTERLLNAITRSQLEFIASDNPSAAFEVLLSSLLKLTGSEYGFIGEVLHKDDTPYLKTHAVTDISWDEETRAFYQQNAPQGLEFYNLNTLFGAVMLTGEMILSNDPANDPRAGGLPPGHPPLNSFLGIPLHLDGELVGMAGIANREGGYDESLYHQLEPLRITTATLVYGFRARRDRQVTANALSSSQKQFSAVFEHMLDGLILIDFRGTMVEINPAACRLFQYSRDQVIGRNVSMLMPGHHAAEHDDYLRRYFKTGERHVVGEVRELEGLRADGTCFPFELRVSEVQDGDSRYFVGTIRDVSEQQAQEAQLQEARDALEDERWRLANIIDGTNVGTWEWNVQTGETRFNERWADIIGYTLEELSPVSIETWAAHANPDDLKQSDAALQKHFKGEADFYELECRMKHRDGHWVWVLDRGKVFSWTEDGKPLLMFGTHQDISERKEHESQMEFMATHDPLTKLPQLSIIYDRIRMAAERSKREQKAAALYFLDLDRFKHVNDSFGHRIGDRLLQEVATRLKSTLRGVDTVARIGGDEFIVLATDVGNRANAELVANKLLALMNAPIDIEGHSTNVGFSIGIAMIPDDGVEPEHLIHAADTAMYHIKSAGKGGFGFFSDSIEEPMD